MRVRIVTPQQSLAWWAPVAAACGAHGGLGRAELTFKESVMQFSQVMAQVRGEGGHWQAAVDDSWLQGRSVFGGLQAALAVRALQPQAAPGLWLRTLQVSFLAPLPAGKVQIRTERLRQGKHTEQWQARLMLGDDTVCLVVAAFGADRASKVQVRPQPALPSNPQAEALPYVAGATPAFIQHFRARWLVGALPFSGQGGTRQVLELGLVDDGPLDACQLLAFADFIPPIGLAHLDTPTPGSSLSWMLQLLIDPAGQSPDGWHVDARLDAAGEGYTSQQLALWAPDGRLAALGQQSMVVFG